MSDDGGVTPSQASRERTLRRRGRAKGLWALGGFETRCNQTAMLRWEDTGRGTRGASKPVAYGADACRRLSFDGTREGRRLTNGGAEVRTGLVKCDRPGSQGAWGTWLMAELCTHLATERVRLATLRLQAQASHFYPDNSPSGSASRKGWRVQWEAVPPRQESGAS